MTKNSVPPNVKSAETAKLWVSCRLEVRRRALAREFYGTQILRFAQSNRKLNVRGGRLPPLAGWREPASARPLRPLSVRLGTTGGAIPSSTDTAAGASANLLVLVRDAGPTEDGRKGLTYNSSAVKKTTTDLCTDCSVIATKSALDRFFLNVTIQIASARGIY